MVDITDPKRYWDLGGYFTSENKTNTYRDWEGMADPTEGLKRVESLSLLNPVENRGDIFTETDNRENLGRQMARDMVLHYLHELNDQVGPEALPDDKQLEAVADFAYFMFSADVCRYMMRSDAE
jgi:hypothetical protein